jgi:hypothetical protein
VYGEDEFWASAALEPFDGWSRSGRASAIQPSSSGRRTLLRAAASTVVLASVGAVGGLMAITGAPPFPHAGRRAVASLLARERSSPSSRTAGTHIWRAQVSSPGSRAPRAGVARSRRLARRALARRAIARVPAPVRSELASAPRVASAIEPDQGGAAVEVAAVSVSAHAVAPAPVGSPARTGGSTAAEQSSPSPAEFGFER